MSVETPRYVFGPVPSRRLGLSLGVDVVPFKTCTHDCIYCQLGRTTRRTAERAEWVPAEAVLSQVKEALRTGPAPEVISFAGSGEPTLHLGIGRMIEGIKALTGIPVVILTNGSLFHLPEVRRACALADVVVPSLDAGTEAVFQRVNRPEPGMTLAGHVDGLCAFRREFGRQLWLEIMLVEGVNASDDEIAAMRVQVERIRPDRVQLNTVVRPPAEPDAGGVSRERLAAICGMFGGPCDVVASFSSRHAGAGGESARVPHSGDDVLAMIRCHPCTADDVAAGLGISREQADGYLAALTADGRIRRRTMGHGEYYEASLRG